VKTVLESRSVACTNPDNKSKLNDSVIKAGNVIGAGRCNWNSWSSCCTGTSAGGLRGRGRVGAVVGGGMCRGGFFVVGACGLRRRRGRSLVSRGGSRTSPVPVEIEFTNRGGGENLEETLSHVNSTPAAGRAQIDHGSRLGFSLIVDGDLLATSGSATEVSSVHGNSHIMGVIKTSAGNFTRSNIVVSAWNTAFTFSKRASNVPVGASFDTGRSLVATQDGRRSGKENGSREKTR